MLRMGIGGFKLTPMAPLLLDFGHNKYLMGWHIKQLTSQLVEKHIVHLVNLFQQWETVITM